MGEAKRIYFKKERKLLKLLQKQKGVIISEIQLNTPIKVTPELLLSKEYKLVYCKLTEVNGQVMYYDAVLTKDSRIFLYLSRVDISENRFNIKMYFDSSIINEVKFFINNLTKLKD